MPLSPHIAIPEPVEWELDGAKFEQSELNLDGEIALVRTLTGVLARLGGGDAGLDLDRLLDVVRADGSIDVGLAIAFAQGAIEDVVPTMTDLAAIFLNVRAKRPDGQPNPDYDVQLAHIREGINVRRFEAMCRTFVQQNEVDRLMRPFVDRIRGFLGRVGDRVDAALDGAVPERSSGTSSTGSSGSPALASVPPASSPAG